MGIQQGGRCADAGQREYAMGQAALRCGSAQRAIEIVVGLISLALISSPLWGSILVPVLWSWAFLAFSVYWLVKSVYLAVQGYIAYRSLQVWDECDWVGLGSQEP